MALYDPHEFPEAEVTTDFTLADVLAWARTKPADLAYDFCEPHECALGQFVRERRLGDPMGSGFWAGGKCHRYGEVLLGAAQDRRGEDWKRDQIWTFGAFADRLEKALSA